MYVCVVVFEQRQELTGGLDDKTVEADSKAESNEKRREKGRKKERKQIQRQEDNKTL